MERDFNSRSNSLVLHISTHTLTWSVTGGSAPPQSFRPISTHTLTWSVTCAWRRALKTYGHFNSHAHVERDNRKTPPHFDNWHFNSHAHVERDFWELGILNAKKISTHTLTWSVTYLFLTLTVPNVISTHTLTWSVTKLQILLSLYQCISTHTLTWSVTEVKEAMNGRLCISTHTLTWSVTRHLHIYRLFNNNFNSHAHVERDHF